MIYSNTTGARVMTPQVLNLGRRYPAEKVMKPDGVKSIYQRRWITLIQPIQK